MTNIAQKFHNGKNGFALLIGVLMTAILISISYSLFSISLKQTTLSIAGKDSQIAFYAADTGLECAVYADTDSSKITNAFVSVDTTSLPPYTYTLTDPGANPESPRPNLNCNNETITPTSVSGAEVDGYSAIGSTFKVNSYRRPNDPSCAIVYVYKYLNSNSEIKTRIESRGYNSCTNENDPQRLERGLEFKY